MDVSLPRMAPGTRRGSDGELTWERIGLGFDLACPFVAAYLLVRSGESALVDTGIEGNADAIEASLTDLGLGWVDLGHVILTHWHGDHTGSAPEILLRAPNATGYAGAEDIARLPVPLELTALADGDRVFGLEIVATPGHTPGSISVFDPVARLLVAGDAVMATDGAPTLPPAQSTEDMGLAKRSIVKMGALDFETLLVGHGEPIESGAGAMVASLGAN